MKKVTGFISVDALGQYDFEFFVPDDTPTEEIERLVDEKTGYYQEYHVEEGYEEYTETRYRKKN